MKKTITFLLMVLMLLSAFAVPASSQSPESLNCTVTPDQILGQAFSMGAGAVGETSENGITPEGVDIEAENLALDAGWILNTLQYSGTGSEKVAILVIDDFSSDPDDDPRSHGWLVYGVFEALYDELPSNLASLITLETVNIGGSNGYRSDLLAQTLDSRMSQLEGQGIHRFVLNMSFVIVPCQDGATGFNFFDFQSTWENNPSQSMVGELTNDPTYLTSLLQNSGLEYIDETGFEMKPGQGGPPAFVQEKLLIFRLFESPQLQSDPLRDFFRKGDHDMIPVAAAGNLKWKRPFFPARWQEVLSVSASEGDDLTQRWSHSNNGEVSAPGAWFLLDRTHFAGTSLAAPVVSWLLALDQTQSSPQCGLRGVQPDLSSGKYDNTPLLNAVSQKC